ncbi:MAG: hypothetical protein JO235_06120 [Chroococcidiopsidaceae cyanobacterium CP_BM_RX_35]|nr:hypothetical protein [Chroococcidiopsidaceae cyanobacterium CP_BM_RX_35]
MPRNSLHKLKEEKLKKRHKFFLNPYEDSAFTKCPKCEAKTKIRKIPLVIHIEQQQLFLLNKQCRYCANCDLIITKQQEIESLLAVSFSQSHSQFIGNDYSVIGTLDRQDWKEGNKGTLSPQKIMERIYGFQDVWDFEVIPAGWYPADET